MRNYVIATAALFALVVVARLVRLGREGLQLLQEPQFALTTLVPAVLCVWAWRVLTKE